MRVIVDTCIWSKALRRNLHPNPYQSELQELIIEKRAYIIGPIRQELLSGIKDVNAFKQLKDYLSGFPDLVINREDYYRAAELYNSLRKKGIQGSHIDFLICAIAQKNEMGIFTDDKDFYRYAKHLHIQLHPKTH